MADLTFSSSRVVAQQPGVVHDRLIELAERLGREAPAVPAGSQAASFMGFSGPVAIEIADRGPGRVELRTTQGRVRGSAAALIAATADGGTALTMSVAIQPQGFAANVMLGAALGARPQLRQQIVDGLERALDDLAIELAKPAEEWDAASWWPPSLPR